MHPDKAIELIKKGVSGESKSVWADLGCGRGTFTQALATLLPPGSTIYAVDSSLSALSSVPSNVSVHIEKVKADFVNEFSPPCSLDGILMANALHFVKDKISFFQKAGNWLTEKGGIVLVEYDTDKANPWVPFPVSFVSAQQLFRQLNYTVSEKIGDQPSVYQRAGFYSILIKK